MTLNVIQLIKSSERLKTHRETQQLARADAEIFDRDIDTENI
jgi:hypothetical protein